MSARSESEKRTPMELWDQANRENPGNASARGYRYRELMREHGHIIDREKLRCQAQDNFYACTLDWDHEGDHISRSGCISAHRWPRKMDDLLTAEEQAALNADLARMARQRRSAEVRSRNLELP